MPFIIVREDLTRMHVDAVVNTSNTKLLPSQGGVSGAIFQAAGSDLLHSACEKIGSCPFGNAIITPGFQLPAAHIIHTPVMVWQDGFHDEEGTLRECYQACLNAAAEQEYTSVAFPLMGGGSHGYPKQLAFTVAIQEISSFLLSYDYEMTVYLVVFGHRAYALSQRLACAVQEYVDDHYVDERPERRRVLTNEDRLIPERCCTGKDRRSTEEKSQPEGISFAQAMMKYIDGHAMTDPDVYRRANISRQHYYRIKIGKCAPKKKTVLALCIAMRLNVEDVDRYLALAGYALSPTSRPDLIVRYFVTRGVFDIMQINQTLFESGYGKHQLGGIEM